MACPQCAINPLSHSFRRYGSVGQMDYYYTCPALAQERINTDEQYAFFKTHLDGAREGSGAWVWLFDCSGMGFSYMSSLSFLRHLVNTLVLEHDAVLHEIWIIRPSFWIRTAIWLTWNYMNETLRNKIVYVDSETDLQLRLNLRHANFYV